MANPNYKIQKLEIAEAAKYLNQDYGMGWRVVQMAVHPDGDHLIFLLENASVAEKG